MSEVFYLCFSLMTGMLLGGILSLGGVALGGVLVFKTKRESFETLFGQNPVQASVGSLDEAPPSLVRTGEHRGNAGSDPDIVSSLFDAMEKSNLQFLKQQQEQPVEKEASNG